MLRAIQSKNFWKGLAKIAVTSVALWVVSLKIDLTQVFRIFPTLNWFYVAICIVLTVLMFLIAALRLNKIYRSAQIVFSERFNLQLYLLGMFYNLFLPGGMGGDAYKIYLLKKHKISSLGRLVKSSLLDRSGGAWALIMLAMALLLSLQGFQWKGWVVFLMFAITLIYYACVCWFFKLFRKVFFIVLFKSLFLQSVALVAVFLALKAMHVEANYVLYLLSFLVAALSIMIPFSIGGLGLRELAFIYMAEWLHIDANIGVTLSLLIYLVTSLISFSGAYYVFHFSIIKEGLKKYSPN